MKIVFMGTPEFAVPSISMLVNEGYKVAAVVTQPDKPKGRGNKVSMPPVKEFAQKHDIQVLQPEKIKTSEFASVLRNIAPDLLITVAYGKILSKELLDIPPLGCINVHGSLLPKYRGAAPIQWAVIKGEKETGITTMFTDVGMDTGDMLLKRTIPIGQDTTAGELHDVLSVLGAEVLKDTLRSLVDGSLPRTPQPNELATYAPMMTKETGCIDWTRSSDGVHNLVRGTNPWPGAYTHYKGARMRVWKTTVIDDTTCKDNAPGTILEVDKSGIMIACGKGCLMVSEIQFDSSRKMCVEEYICGHMINVGEVLG